MPVITRREARDAAEGVGLAFIGTIAVIVLLLALGIGLWAFGVFTSGIKGHGDVIKKNNSADNQIQAQATFNALWNDIQADHANIASTAAALKANPSDTFQQSVLAAQQQTCRNAVAQYNADATDTTLREWRPAADPASIDPTTECETTP